MPSPVVKPQFILDMLPAAMPAAGAFVFKSPVVAETVKRDSSSQTDDLVGKIADKLERCLTQPQLLCAAGQLNISPGVGCRKHVIAMLIGMKVADDEVDDLVNRVKKGGPVRLPVRAA